MKQPRSEISDEDDEVSYLLRSEDIGVAEFLIGEKSHGGLE